MRAPTVLALALVVLAGLPAVEAAKGALLEVADGSFFYDSIPDAKCRGDTNDWRAGDPLRHWHKAVPVVAPTLESPFGPGGYGCLGGPRTWSLVVPAGREAVMQGSLRYTWDAEWSDGGQNDVHLHVYNAQGVPAASSLLTDGPSPTLPGVLPVREHPIEFRLRPGSYRLQEDVASGEHTSWLTNLIVLLE